MTAGEPTRAEVLQWLSLTGRSQGECIAELWGPLDDESRRRVEARVRQWVRRARSGEVPTRTGPPPAAQQAGPAPAGVPRTPASPPPAPAPAVSSNREASASAETRIAFLTRKLAELEQDVADARATRQLRLVPGLEKQISSYRADLDLELERERRVVRLERTPLAICARLREVAPAVALRAEMHRRAAERAAREEE